MSETLELPNSDVVTPDDVFLYNEYPYRVSFVDDETYEFELSPLYWGGGEMDVPFRDRDALYEQWGEGSRGVLTPNEWEQWLREARRDDRFGDDELDALARELPTEDGFVARIRRTLGF
ncbi:MULTISPECIES: hypothetical protein [Halorussus]|uniref:hypothetical protein n=1 Tax=Halorussus TaxID=1070314 RepID=UPI0020A1829B|nr:hypothetical protein [Halorussus vallis]USZ74681.1 hypothetical protein NGM07_14700 [Halorussus vallis]